MAKSYKPIGETYSRNRPCLRCFHCKTRVFRSKIELKDWCREREWAFSYAWEKRFNKDKELCLYWCSALKIINVRVKPRIFRLSDKPFLENCELFNG